MCNQFTFHHHFGIDTWRSKFKQQTDSIIFCVWIPWPKTIRIFIRSTWLYRAIQNTCIKHGRDIRTQYNGSTSMFLWRKDWSSIRLDSQFFVKHFQLIVFRKLSEWKLEKIIRTSLHVTSASTKGLLETRVENKIGFRTCSTTRSSSCATI